MVSHRTVFCTAVSRGSSAVHASRMGSQRGLPVRRLRCQDLGPIRCGCPVTRLSCRAGGHAGERADRHRDDRHWVQEWADSAVEAPRDANIGGGPHPRAPLPEAAPTEVRRTNRTPFREASDRLRAEGVFEIRACPAASYVTPSSCEVVEKLHVRGRIRSPGETTRPRRADRRSGLQSAAPRRHPGRGRSVTSCVTVERRSDTAKGMCRIAPEHALNWPNVVGDTGFEPVTSTVSR